MGCCTERWFCYMCTLWLYGWVGIFVALDLFRICFFNRKNCFEIPHNVSCPLKFLECLGGSCILILTVTTFHGNIRHRPTKLSVQAAKNYKSMFYFLASYPSWTTWPIAIIMRVIISISVYFLGLLLLFFYFSWDFFVWFQKFTLT